MNLPETVDQAIGDRNERAARFTFTATLADAVVGSLAFEWTGRGALAAPVRVTEIDWIPIVRAALHAPSIAETTKSLFVRLAECGRLFSARDWRLEVPERLMRLIVWGLHIPDSAVHLAVARAFDKQRSFERVGEPHLMSLLS